MAKNSYPISDQNNWSKWLKLACEQAHLRVTRERRREKRSSGKESGAFSSRGHAVHACASMRASVPQVKIWTLVWKLLRVKYYTNRPFPSSLVPLFQNESKYETFLMKMSSACSFILMQIKVIFITMVSHLDSLWNRGTRELGNGLFYCPVFRDND